MADSPKKARSVSVTRGEHGFIIREEPRGAAAMLSGLNGAETRFWAFSTPAEVATWMLSNFGPEA